MDKVRFSTVDEYIETFPPSTREKLRRMRAIIREEAPEAVEKIAYQMPTYYQKGNLVHFAAYSGHIGFYPTPAGISNFQQELAGYKSAKGSVQFPLDQPLPETLIRAIVRFRLEEQGIARP